MEVNGDEVSSDEEEEEGLERKIARLRREIAEVKGEVERQKAEDEGTGTKKVKSEDDQNKKQEGQQGQVDDIDALNEVLNSAASTAGVDRHDSAVKFTKRLAQTSSAQPATQPATQPASTSRSVDNARSRA